MGGLGVFIVVGLISLGVWIFFEASNFKSKIYTTLILSFLTFLLISSAFLFKGRDIDLSTSEGIVEAGVIYVSFVTVAIKNVFTVTANAINMDWAPEKNQSSSKK